MSRSLGARAVHKVRAKESGPKAEGIAAFKAGQPRTANPYSPGRGGQSKGGKHNAWAKGYRLAEMGKH